MFSPNLRMVGFCSKLSFFSFPFFKSLNMPYSSATLLGAENASECLVCMMQSVRRRRCIVLTVLLPHNDVLTDNNDTFQAALSYLFIFCTCAPFIILARHWEMQPIIWFALYSIRLRSCIVLTVLRCSTTFSPMLIFPTKERSTSQLHQMTRKRGLLSHRSSAFKQRLMESLIRRRCYGHLSPAVIW